MAVHAERGQERMSKVKTSARFVRPGLEEHDEDEQDVVTEWNGTAKAAKAAKAQTQTFNQPNVENTSKEEGIPGEAHLLEQDSSSAPWKDFVDSDPVATGPERDASPPDDIYRYPGAYREGGIQLDDSSSLTMLESGAGAARASPPLVLEQQADTCPILMAMPVEEEEEDDNDDSLQHKRMRYLLYCLIGAVLVCIVVAVVSFFVASRGTPSATEGGSDGTTPTPHPTSSSSGPEPTFGPLPEVTGEWLQLGQDMDGEAADDRSGFAVALSGDASVVAVGAWRNDGINGEDSGHARIYAYNEEDNEWIQVGNDVDGSEAGDRSGRSVALSQDGRTVAVGARLHNASAGQVRVFSYDESSNSWIQVGRDLDGSASFDQAGHSVALSSDGSIVAFGAIFHSSHIQDGGQVHVFQLQNGDWVQFGDIVGTVKGGSLGRSVALSSDGLTLAAGASFNIDDSIVHPPGEVHVYSWNGDSWNLVGQVLTGNANDDGFGSSVDLSSNGRVVAVGAPQPQGTGLVQVYSFDGAIWAPLGSSVEGEDPNDQFGRSLSLSADGLMLAVGSYRNSNDGRIFDGSTRVFAYNGSAWTQVGSDINGEGDDDRAGWSVSIAGDGRSLVIGGRLNDGVAGSNSGHARAYQLVS